MQLITRSILVLFASLLLVTPALADEPSSQGPQGYWVQVSGTGIHYFSTSIIHSQQPTETGFVQRSTDIVELDGDLRGYVLYHPVSVFDFEAGTLVNSGHQVFSGTILGSEPVMILDDEFRFDVNLWTQEVRGNNLLMYPLAGPKVRCELDVIGTGQTPEGDGLAVYTGRCLVKADEIEN